jgi:hypothetical protein
MPITASSAILAVHSPSWFGQRCVAELNQSFQVHNGELYKIKEQMPCIIETIIMCYKGYCGYSCKVNSFVCAGGVSDLLLHFFGSR